MFDNSIFTLNITILHVVFMCIKWKQGFYDLYVHGNMQKNYCLWAKKLMDNNIFSGDGEKIRFCCGYYNNVSVFDAKV